MKKIETLRPKIPWRWIPVICLPWVATNYVEHCSKDPLTWTLRKFVEDPALISFLSSINIIFNFMVGAVTCYISDRIWTPMGRRSPFLVAGWLGVAVMMIFIPMAASLQMLIGIIVLYQFFQDVAKPIEPLYNEVIPPPQRGRASTIRNILQRSAILFAAGVLTVQYGWIYRIDSQNRVLEIIREKGQPSYVFSHVPFLNSLGRDVSFSGDYVIFWTGALLLISVSLIVALFVKERPPLEKLQKTGGSAIRQVRRYLHETFSERQSLMIYLLWMAPFMVAGVAWNPMKALFLTEQIGFAKEEIGKVGLITMPLEFLLILPAAGLLVDRVNRLKLMRIGMAGPALIYLGFYAVIRFVTDYHVSFRAYVIMELCVSMFMSLLFVAWGPTLYDYIKSNRMGTVSGGLCIVGGIGGFLLMNLGGLWVKGATRLFGAAGPAMEQMTPVPDYSSYILLQFVLTVLAVWVVRCFEREVKAGRVIAYATLELEKEKQLKEKTADLAE